MRNAWYAVVIGCVWALSALAHPWHSSTGELHWNAEDGVFELALEMDAHHLEEALSRRVDGWVDLESERAGPMLDAMLERSFVVWSRPMATNGAVAPEWQRAAFEFVGSEIDGASVWLYAAFEPEVSGADTIEAMVRNVFMRPELPELRVTLRVSGGESRPAGSGGIEQDALDEQQQDQQEPDLPGTHVLNFVHEDAASGHRPKGMSIVFRYGLTKEDIERRRELHVRRAVAKARLGDAVGATVELSRAHAIGLKTSDSQISDELAALSLDAWVAGEPMPEGVEADDEPMLVLWVSEQALLSIILERDVGGTVMFVSDDPEDVERGVTLVHSAREWVANYVGGDMKYDGVSGEALFELLRIADAPIIGQTDRLQIVFDDPEQPTLTAMVHLLISEDGGLGYTVAPTVRRLFRFDPKRAVGVGRFEKD